MLSCVDMTGYLLKIFRVTSPTAAPRLKTFPPRVLPATDSSESNRAFALPTAARAFCVTGRMFSRITLPVAVSEFFCSEIMSETSRFTGIEPKESFWEKRNSVDAFFVSSVVDLTTEPRPN